jgi:hypothetical protein
MSRVFGQLMPMPSFVLQTIKAVFSFVVVSVLRSAV